MSVKHESTSKTPFSPQAIIQFQVAMKKASIVHTLKSRQDLLMKKSDKCLSRASSQVPAFSIQHVLTHAVRKYETDGADESSLYSRQDSSSFH
jgi:hypothetical protein